MVRYTRPLWKVTSLTLTSQSHHEQQKLYCQIWWLMFKPAACIYAICIRRKRPFPDRIGVRLCIKWWKVLSLPWQLHLVEKLILPTFRLDALVLLITLGRTRASSRNVGKISFLTKWSCLEENLSSFHVYWSNWEIAVFTCVYIVPVQALCLAVGRGILYSAGSDLSLRSWHIDSLEEIGVVKVHGMAVAYSTIYARCNQAREPKFEFGLQY